MILRSGSIIILTLGNLSKFNGAVVAGDTINTSSSLKMLMQFVCTCQSVGGVMVGFSSIVVLVDFPKLFI